MINPCWVFPILLLLAGCASAPFGKAGAGGAVYRYEHTADGGCSIEISSSRDLVGVSVDIVECDVAVSAEKTDGTRALDVIGSLVNKIP